MMFTRIALTRVERALARAPAVALLGARQVGKTTLARAIAADAPRAVYLDLERREDRARLLSEPSLFLSRNRDALVVLDEVQHAPEIFAELRGEIDLDRRASRFLILGSASRNLIRQSSESLAGRIEFVEMEPLTIAETGIDFSGIEAIWWRGGFPGSYLARNDADSITWRENFIRTFLERDLPQLGFPVSAPTAERFWRMPAHHHGQLFNASQLGASMSMAHTTIRRWGDMLEAALVVRRLEPFHAILGKRLVKSPKLCIRDSGLLHSLLGIRSVDQLQALPVLGASWEGFAIEQILTQLPHRMPVSFFRTIVGAEIDLLIENGLRRYAIEVKFSVAPKPARGFWQAISDLEVDKGFVVAPVSRGYPLAPNVDVVGPTELSSVIRGIAEP